MNIHHQIFILPYLKQNKTIMKPLFILLLSALTICLFTNSSCKKNNPPANATCGCASTTITQQLSNTTATLGYLNNQYQQGWFVFVKFPYNASWHCKICNLDKVQSIINSMTQNDTLSVKVSGKLRDFCPDEPIGIYTSIVVPYHLTIDSLKRN